MCPPVKIISQPSCHWTLHQKLSRAQKLKELFNKFLINFAAQEKVALGSVWQREIQEKLSLCHRPSQKFGNLEILKNWVKSTGSTSGTRRKDNLYVSMIGLRDARLQVKVFLGGSVQCFQKRLAFESVSRVEQVSTPM